MPFFAKLFKPNIEKLRANGDIDGLVKALENDDVEIQEETFEALKSLPRQAVIESLLAVVKEYKNITYAYRAAFALVRLGDYQALKPFIGLLILRGRIPDFYVNDIGNLKEPDAGELLCKIVQSTNQTELQQAAELIGKMGDSKVVELLILIPRSIEWNYQQAEPSGVADSVIKRCNQAFEIIIQSFIKAGNPNTAELLLQAIQGSSWGMSQIAVKLLPQGCDSQTVGHLIILLKSNYNPVYKPTVVDALVEIGDIRAINPLFDYLENDLDSSLKMIADYPSMLNRCEWCILTLGRLVNLGDPRPVAILQKMLDYSDEQIRHAAVQAMDQVKGNQIIPSLLQSLQNQDESVREAALSSLKKFKSPQEITLISSGLLGANQSSRKSLARILALSGWQPGKDEIGAAYWMTEENWQRCIEIGAPAVPVLIAALKDSDDEIAKGAARTLAAIGDKRAIEPLISALRDWDVIKCITLEKVIPVFGKDAVEPLLAALKSSDGYQQARVIGILRDLKDRRAVEPLIAVFEGSDENKTSAARALGDLGDIRAAKALIPALLNERYRTPADPLEFYHQDIHTAAASALKQLGSPALVDLALALLSSDENWRNSAAQALVELEVIPDWFKLAPEMAAGGVLAKIGLPAVEPLIELLENRSDEKELAWTVVAVINDLGKPAVDLLMNAFQNNWRVRLPIIRGYQKLGNMQVVLKDMQAVDVLVHALYSYDLQERWEACWALDSLGWHPDTDELSQQYSKIREDVAQRDAARAFGELNRRYGHHS